MRVCGSGTSPSSSQSDKTTFEAYVERWLQVYVAVHCKPRTLDVYTFLCRRHPFPVLGVVRRPSAMASGCDTRRSRSRWTSTVTSSRGPTEAPWIGWPPQPATTPATNEQNRIEEGEDSTEKGWSRGRELNPRPTDYESVALPLSYPGIRP